MLNNFTEKSLRRPDTRGYLTRVLHDLVACGWTLSSAPENKRIPRNGAKIILKADEIELRLRIFVYKVTSSGRNLHHERRVEITTTYQSGLKPLKRFADIVIGLDETSGKYVGVDSRRLGLGGSTHNASSFFDLEGLSVKSGELLVNPRRASSDIFPNSIEFHAFFDGTRLSEYLVNHREIHSGSYTYSGAFNGKIKPKHIALPLIISDDKLAEDVFVLHAKTPKPKRPIKTKQIEAVESNDFSALPRSQRKITPEQLKQLLIICDEVGALGEQKVLVEERKRLIRLGHAPKANDVERVSLRSVGEGYDILSFEDDGRTLRYLEVKSTVGRSSFVDISRGEWAAARKYGEHYYLVRVTDVRKDGKLYYIKNPFLLESQGRVQKTETGWKLDLSAVMV